VASLTLAPIIGSVLGKIGRKNSIIVGFMISGIATVGFAVISYIPDE
jgi:hypothetical protein